MANELIKSNLEKCINDLYVGFCKYTKDSVYETGDLIAWKNPKAYQWLVSIDNTKYIFFWIDNGVLYAKKHMEDNQWRIYSM